MARRDGGPDQRLMIAIASRQTTSSIDSAPCQRTAGVGQTFSNVSDASSSTSAAKSASHFIWTLEFFTRDKKIRRLIFEKILLIFGLLFQIVSHYAEERCMRQSHSESTKKE